MSKKTKTTEATPTIEAAGATPATKTAKPPKAAATKAPAKKAKPAKEKKLSALDAAAKVLGETGQPMTSGELIEAMSKKGYWSSPNGQTPGATLCRDHSGNRQEGERIAVRQGRARQVRTDQGRVARLAPPISPTRPHVGASAR
jgi:HB1, ASXL, restriction endonuclease HTH domain